MDRKRFEHIITQYLKGQATPEEETELLQAIDTSKELHAAFRQQVSAWNPLTETTSDMDRKWDRIASIIQPSQEDKEDIPVITLPSASKRVAWFSIAAAVILLCISGITVYLLKQTDKNLSGTGEWQTITADSEDQSCVLPDGTSVYLREGAELRYPKAFEANVRNVTIRGEAFFQVTPDKQKPFIVDASGLAVKVVGTSFSVQTSDEGKHVSVILVEGKVSLSDARQKELALLLPDQEANYSVLDGACTVTQVDSERLTSWRKGILSYDNASLEEIVRLIERTYKVSLSYTPPVNNDQRFSGAFLKNQPLDLVLQQTSKLTGTELNTP